MFWVLFSFVVVLFAYLKLYKPLSYWKDQRIPYLKPWPIVGNMLPLVLGQEPTFSLFAKWYKIMNTRYFGIYQFTKPILIIRDIELAKHVCIKDFDYFMDHKTFINETNEPVFKENLFAFQGDQWRELRGMLSPAFTGSKMRAMFILISECSERFINFFLKTCLANECKEVELKTIYKRLTIDIIATCVFGVESNSLEDEHNDFYEMGKDIGDFSGLKSWKPLGFLLFPSVMRFFNVAFFSKEQINFFRDIVTKTIDFREKNGIVRPDMLHLMMQARKGQLKFEDSAAFSDTGFATVEESDVGKNSNDKLEVTDDLIIAQAMIFFLGGTETTSTAMCFLSYELAINPNIQRRLQEEIDNVYKECNGKITYEAISKMKYLDMVVSESMRKWPQSYFLDRLCVKDYEVKPVVPGEKPYIIKQGQSLVIPVIGFHKDPNFYEEPERFNPQRFNDDNKHKINSSAFLPFGQGPRSCIGSRFALLVMKTVVFHLLHKFNLVVTKKTEIPFTVSKTELFITAANGFWVGLQRRTS